MHILYVLPKDDYFSQGRRGRVAHALGVVDGLRSNGAQITVVSGEGTAATFAAVESVRAVEIRPTGQTFRQRWQWITELIGAVERIIRSDAVDALVVRYAVANAFRFSSLFHELPNLARCFEVNSLAYNQYYRFPLIVRRLVKRFEARTLNTVDLLYVVSSRLAKDIATKGAGGPRIVVLPNAGNYRPALIDYTCGPITRGAKQPVKFVYMGVFQPYYELDLVVAAFRRARKNGMEAELHLYGDGDQYPKIMRLVSDVHDMFLHGRYDLDSVLASRTLDSATVLLLPNREKGMSEIGSPIKLYEYMSFGLPILASAVAQARDVLRNRVTCVFYEAGCVESCADGMTILAADPELRKSIGRSVRDDFLRSHTWDVRMAQLERELATIRVARLDDD